ncbi:MAG: hypothetical protein JWO92_877 [Chitinophagaceae bacterium]|nr:hypothetical protein [Chitinophagaceae bacterium]
MPHLSKKEISSIIKEAETNLEYQNDKILHIGKAHSSIIKVSKIHKLILIEGNDKTGFQHINKRHDYFQSRFDWKGNKLGTGSKFWSRTFGYWDYLKIADEIYTTKNMVQDNEQNAYNLYRAKLKINDVECFYRLVVYNGTKIIHTIYPEENISIWKKSINFNFIRQISNTSIDYANCLKNVTMTYSNKKEIVYSIRIIKDFNRKIEVIEIFDIKKGIQIYKEQNPYLLAFSFFPIELLMYEDADLIIWEQRILDYHNNNLN